MHTRLRSIGPTGFGRGATLACLWVVATFVGDCTAAAGENPKAYVRRTDTELTVGNAYVELQINVAQNRVAAKCLVNKLTGQSVPISADNFSLGLEGSEPLAAADFALREVREEELPRVASGSCCSWPATRTTATIELQYTLGDRDFFLRRQIVLQTKRPLPLRHVDVWSVRRRGQGGAPGLRRAGVPGRHLLGPGIPRRSQRVRRRRGDAQPVSRPHRHRPLREQDGRAGRGRSGTWRDSSSDTSRPSRRRRKPPGCSSTTTPGGR